ncbi:hypothetical protein [Tuwongella immobilis]|uniref:Uncharacterized protein n=1 Tax=Tuwongella immobilis TaxID=692036 RepID=A0A6C2YI26_9BACT|nr:hypothetical protein [Tuwongella immobilis]VIP00793.1 unnamed protein product [Tuwongella immobilis]VTR97004.1 unnamed protein product [Tuwongella immobilis]
MGSIQFNARDAELLYSFPKPASDVATIVRCFVFLNRAAPPSFGEFASCLTKGLRAGIIREEGERFVIDDDWYGRIHMADATAENEIESMLEFESRFVGVDFDATTDAACALTEGEYESVLAKLR